MNKFIVLIFILITSFIQACQCPKEKMLEAEYKPYLKKVVGFCGSSDSNSIKTSNTQYRVKSDTQINFTITCPSVASESSTSVALASDNPQGVTCFDKNERKIQLACLRNSSNDEHWQCEMRDSDGSDCDLSNQIPKQMALRLEASLKGSPL